MTTTLVQLRCSSLRSKSSYAAYGDFAEEHAELLGATTSYWCLRTMGKAGPDDLSARAAHTALLDVRRRDGRAAVQLGAAAAGAPLSGGYVREPVPAEQRQWHVYRHAASQPGADLAHSRHRSHRRRR